MCAREPKGTAHFLTSPKIPDAKGIFVMIQFTPVGDSGVLAVCGSEISEQVNAQVMALDAAVQAAQLPGVVETVPTYAALLVTLDPLQTDADTLIPALRRLWDALPPVADPAHQDPRGGGGHWRQADGHLPAGFPRRVAADRPHAAAPV